jgi:hypothetical protein
MPRKPQTKPAAEQAPKTETTERPEPIAQTDPRLDWVNNTPAKVDYMLSMCDPFGSAQQDISIDRQEFITLKRVLAAMRTEIISGSLISQEEIETFLELEEAMDALALNWRARLKKGAEVEPGYWSISDEGLEPEFYKKSTAGSLRCGLDIHKTPESEPAKSATATP